MTHDFTEAAVLGTRVRVGLAAPQPLTAELSDASLHALDLKPDAHVIATWKAHICRDFAPVGVVLAHV